MRDQHFVRTRIVCGLVTNDLVSSVHLYYPEIYCYHDIIFIMIKFIVSLIILSTLSLTVVLDIHKLQHYGKT